MGLGAVLNAAAFQVFHFQLLITDVQKYHWSATLTLASLLSSSGTSYGLHRTLPRARHARLTCPRPDRPARPPGGLTQVLSRDPGHDLAFEGNSQSLRFKDDVSCAWGR